MQCAARLGSDAVAEMLRRLDVRYIALVPGSSYRGLHDSLVNYLGNRDPKMLGVCTRSTPSRSRTAMPGDRAADGGRGAFRRRADARHHGDLQHLVQPAAGRILGATGPGDSELRRPWIDWIHTAKDQGALIHNYSKWDDEPRSVQGVVESVMRAHQIASTQPYGPTYVCLDVALQEQAIEGEVRFPDVERFTPGLPPAPAAEAVEERRGFYRAKKPSRGAGFSSRRWQARSRSRGAGCGRAHRH